MGTAGTARPALIAMAFALGAPALAGDSVVDLFREAERGRVAPIVEALESGQHNDDDQALLRARLVADRFDPAVLADAEIRRLATDANDPDQRRIALSLIGAAAFAHADYAAAARAAAAAVPLHAAAADDDRAADAAQMGGLATLLVALPPQRVEGEVSASATPLSHDRFGLPRVDLTINGQGQQAVLDTGANLSVLSASAAARLGVEPIEAEASVGNSVAGDVAVRVARADRLEIAGTTLRNVVFLIIDDSNLSFPNGYRIDAIVGLPVLHALGRMRFEAAGNFAVEPEIGTSAGAQNLHLAGSTLFVEAAVGGIAVPLLLDTGANKSWLNPLFAVAHPAIVAGLATRQARTAGAGGMTTSTSAIWPGPTFTIAGREIVLDSLEVMLPSQVKAPETYGTLGSDLLARFDSYTLDLRAMRLALGTPNPE